MTEITDRITPEMSEEEVLSVLLDEIMTRTEPDVAEAIRFCAIPHWFNEELIAWLRGEGLKSSQRSGEILAALTELTFVGPYHDLGWAYHENVRGLLLRRWWERDGEKFRELSERAAGYFAHKLVAKEETLLARLFASIRRVLGKEETLTEDERRECEREQMYHLLAVDEEQGHELFQSMFDEAIKFYRLSTCSLLLQLAEEFREHLSEEHQQWLRYNQGQLACHAARWDEAWEFFEALLEEELVDKLKGEVLGYAGLVYKAKGEWERAIEYYKRSLAIEEKVGDEHGMAATFNNLGVVYQDKREWERAIEYHERSLMIQEKVGDAHGMAATFNNLGNVYQDKGEWERTIEYYERSLAIKEEMGDAHGMAVTFNNLGEVYRAKGEWERAVEYYERSLAIKEKTGDEHGMAATLNNLGNVYQAKGEWERAIEYYERDLAICEKVGDKQGMATTFNNLGFVYQARGKWEQAIEYYERSLAIAQKIGDEYIVARIFNNLGGVYRAKGKWERAMEYYERSLVIREKMDDEHGMAYIYNNMALLYRTQDELGKAIPLFEKSLMIFERIGDKRSAGTVRGNLKKAKRELETKAGQV
jgi:tetratricopeptide (TPR) repeat protein